MADAPIRQRISADQRLVNDARRATARLVEQQRAAAARLFPGLPVQTYVPFRQRQCAANRSNGAWYAHPHCRCTRCLYCCDVIKNAYDGTMGARAHRDQ